MAYFFFQSVLYYKDLISEQLRSLKCNYTNQRLINIPTAFDKYKSIGLLPENANNYSSLIFKYYSTNIKDRFPFLFESISISSMIEYFSTTEKIYRDIFVYGEYEGVIFAFPGDGGKKRLKQIRYHIEKIEAEINNIISELNNREVTLSEPQKKSSKLKSLFRLRFNKLFTPSIEKSPLIRIKAEDLLDNINKLKDKKNKYILEDSSIKDLMSDIETKFQYQINDLKNNFEEHKREYEAKVNIANYFKFLINHSWYPFDFNKKLEIFYNSETNMLIVDYLLPQKIDIPNKEINKKGDSQELSSTKFQKIYEEILYSIIIRTLCEIYLYDFNLYCDSVCLNGKVIERNPATGNEEEKYILSINVVRNQIEELNLEFINPKECFKSLKGISTSKLYETSAITPIITPKFNDKRIVESKDIELKDTPNLAEMDWEDFEHLVRQIFEWEFGNNGGEVRVTQSSRDGGVDAIVFDPDPIRGGKVIIQAKRYTNTVGVSAVRDLYGTIINEGANKGILITTADYGTDSYNFAQGKPITLLNGGHLLYLLEKYGRKARIDIQEAKNNRSL